MGNRIVRFILVCKAKYQSKKTIVKDIKQLLDDLLIKLGHEDKIPELNLDYKSKEDIRNQVYSQYAPILMKVLYEYENEEKAQMKSRELGKETGAEIRNKIFVPEQFIDIMRLEQAMDSSLGTRVIYVDKVNRIEEKKTSCVLKGVYYETLTQMYPKKAKDAKGKLDPPCAWVCDRFVEGFFTGLLDSKEEAVICHLPLEKGQVCHRETKCNELKDLRRDKKTREWSF